MQGHDLWSLAALVGLTQLDIAYYLHVAPPVLNRWVKGFRPIPKRRRAALVDFVFTTAERAWKAKKHALAALMARDMTTLSEAERTQMEGLRAEIAALHAAGQQAYHDVLGMPPGRSLADVCQDLTALAALPLAERHRPEKLKSMRTLGEQVVQYATLQTAFDARLGEFILGYSALGQMPLGVPLGGFRLGAETSQDEHEVPEQAPTTLQRRRKRSKTPV